MRLFSLSLASLVNTLTERPLLALDVGNRDVDMLSNPLLIGVELLLGGVDNLKMGVVDGERLSYLEGEL